MITKQRKGQAVIGTLIVTLVFLLMLVVAVLPVISTSLNTNSTAWSQSGYAYGNVLNTIVYLIPLFLALAGLVAIAYTYLMR